MALSEVRVSHEVFLACTTQALTNETEEVMGLLLGEVKVEGGRHIANIWKAAPQIRTDRRKDRVETSPEQVAACTALAEKLTHRTGIATRVVGWYHSHPHITVLPSHVDVQTQALYQMMDPSFVGLIWSVFNTDKATQGQQVQVTAFQSLPAHACPLVEMSSTEMEGLEGMDAQMKAALRTSAAESRGTKDSWVWKEVPLNVMEGPTPAANPSPYSDYVDVQAMLFEEEQLHSAPPSRAERRDQARDAPAEVAAAVAELHAAAARQQGLVQLLEVQLGPSLLALQSRRKQLAVQRRQLQEEQRALKAVGAASAGAASSPSRPAGQSVLDELCESMERQDLLS